MNNFKELSDETINILLDGLKTKIPDSIHPYCYLRSLLWLRENNFEAVTKVYAPDGNIADCTFLLYLRSNKLQLMTVYSSTDDGCKRLQQALETCDFVDWKTYFLISCIPTRISKFLEPVWSKLGIKVSQDPGVTYWMSPDNIKVLPTKIPDDVDIRPVTQKDAKLINSVWPHRTEGSEEFIREYIRINLGLGAFKKDSGNLVSWGLHWFYGGVGLIQTVEEEQGNGYGKAVSIEMCKKLDSMGWPVHLIVVEGNEQGKRLFEEKLKFSRIHNNVWISPNGI